MANLPKIQARFSTTTSSAIETDSTTFTLTDHLDANGAELSGLYGFMVDIDNAEFEYILGTVVNGTVTITARGVDQSDGITERAALKKDHLSGAIVKVTDFPVIGQLRNKLAGTESLEALVSYATDLTPSDDKHITPKKYVDDSITTHDATNVHVTGDEAIAGVKTFSESPIVPEPSEDTEAATKKYVDDRVLNTEAQTITGVKTFSSSPIVPTPTEDMEASTKKYVDDIAIAGAPTASEVLPGILKLNTAAADPDNPIAIGANEVAENGASKILKLKSDGKIDTTVIPDASTTVAGKVKLNVAPASATEPIAVGSNDVAETGASKVVRLKSNGKLNTTVLPVLTKGNVMVAGGSNYDTALPVGTDGQSLVADAASPLGVKWASALAPVIKVYRMSFGNGSTRFDITNPVGTTFRYTWDDVGVNPNITLANVPIGTVLVIAGQNFNEGNNGVFTVTGAGSKYFEVTNAAGVAENDKTIGTGSIKIRYTKPSNLLYAIIECIGGGGAADQGNQSTYSTGETSSFGTLLTAVGGGPGMTYNTTWGGVGGIAAGGDLNINGCKGGVVIGLTGSAVTVIPTGGPSALGSIGQGGHGAQTSTAPASSGGGGAYTKKIIAAASIGATEDIKVGNGGTRNDGSGYQGTIGFVGAVIITEIFA